MKTNYLELNTQIEKQLTEFIENISQYLIDLPYVLNICNESYKEKIHKKFLSSKWKKKIVIEH